jgi:cyclopropane-fatty-acyl-phospholipid synthase
MNGFPVGYVPSQSTTTPMHEAFFETRIKNLLSEAGVTVNGTNPWDIRVHDPRFYRRVFLESNLGLGESYMDCWWNCDAMDELFYRILQAKLEDRVSGHLRKLNGVLGMIVNLQKPSRSFAVGETHYNIGNDLYRAMLGKHMQYSCAFWQGTEELDAAQENKLNLVFSKLGLEAGMHILDIGCGWGGAAKYAAERYGAKVTGVTVSSQQAVLAREINRDLPVTILLRDYRDMTGSFDRIYSIGMFEHVGHKNYRTFFSVVRNLLRPDGLFLLHTIGSNRTGTNTDRWTSRYIFPNSMLPSAQHITRGSEGLMVPEDWHSFGHSYSKTLTAWHRNIERHWPELRSSYDERFHRMWTYYLLSAAGSFRSRHVQLWQILFSRNGITGNFHVPRPVFGETTP